MKPLYLLIFLLFLQVKNFAQLPVFTLNTTVVPASCPNNGEISFSVTNTAVGATVIYQVYELPSNTLLSSNSTSTSINSLPPGNYSVVATQNLGAQSNSQSATVTVNSTYIPLVYGITTTQNVICGYDGVINTSITTGMPNYTYELFAGSISGSIVAPLQSSPTFTNLTNGTYIIRTFDACGNAFPSLPVNVGINPQNINNLYNQINYSSVSCDSIDVNLYLNGTSNSFPATSTLSYTDGTLHTITGNADGTFPTQTVAIANFPITFTSISTDACGNVDNFQTIATLNTSQENSHKTKALCEQFYYSFVPNNFFSNSGYTINFTNSPLGFNPLTYNANHPGVFNGSANYGGPTNPLPEGTYTAVLTNSCGLSYTLNFTTFKEIDSSLNSSVSYNNCGQSILSVYRNDLYFDSVYLIQAPNTFTQTLPFDITSSLNSNNSLVSIVLDPGFYKFKFIDSCGITRFFEINLLAPTLEVSFSQLPGCQIGYGSCIFFMNWIGTGLTSTSGIQNCWITSAPSGYGNTLPHDLSSTINTGSNYYHIGNLIPGNYTFSFKNACGDSISKTVIIDDFTFTTTNFEYTINCNYINLRFNVSTNNPSGSFEIQRNINGVWTFITSITGSNIWHNYLAFAEGDYRIIYYNTAYSSNNLAGFANRYETCVPNWSIPFSIDYPDPEIEAINSWNCGLDNYNAYVTATGAGPITYKILKYNGAPFLVNNGNNPLFTNLSEGLYLFQIIDVCGNIRTRYMEIRFINNYIFPDSICDNQNGSLSIYGFSALNTILGFKWWKGSDPSTILSTTTSLNFTPYNNSIHQGEYFVQIYSISNPALCPDTVSYILNTAIIPSAGLDSSAQICNDNTIIDLSQFLSTNATSGGYWSDTVNNLTFYGNQLDLSTTPNDTIHVLYIVEGACNFKDTAVFTFNVIQLDSVQVIHCPSDTIIYGCPQIVDWNTPIFFTSCSTLNALSNFNENDFFPQDTTLVNYTCNGPLGDIKTCNFNVIILDTISPIVTCPNDTTIISNGSTCGKLYTWTAPTFSDNCDTNPILTLSSLPSGLQNGSTFPIGTSTLTYTVIDASGNSTQCSFIVTVIDTTNPVISACPSDTNLNNLIGMCSANYTWIPPQFNDNCDDSLTVWYESSPTAGLTNGSAFPFGKTVITYFVQDNYGNIDSCIFEINVVDNESPQIINCGLDTLLSNDLGICGKVYTWITPTFTDNCDNAPTIILTSWPTIGLQNGDTLPVGTTYFKYFVTDEYGNSDSCMFEITVQDNEAPSFLNCASDTTINNNIDICSAIFNWNSPLILDNCDGSPSLSFQTFPTTNLISGDLFPLGQTTIQYTAIDSIGNESTCSFVVNVIDVQDPVIFNCPTDTILSNEATICGAHVTWITPTFSDNCDTNLTITLSSSPTAGLQNGAIFPVGITTMNYLIVDNFGNQVNCSFTIEILDNEFPVIQNIPTQILNFCDGDNVDWATILASDNCSIETFDYKTSPTPNLLEGTPFPIGNTTVTYTAIDQAGNTTIDSFFVHVEPLLVAKVSGKHKACKDDVVSLPITFSCINGLAPYEFIYSINGGPNLSVISPNSNTITIFHPTSISDTFNYQLINVIESSGNYCPPILLDSGQVIIYPLPVATIIGDTIVCQYSEPSKIIFTGSNATPNYSFNYTINGGLNYIVQTLNNNDNLSIETITSEIGNFVYTLNLVTESANNCKQQQAQSIIIAVKASPSASFYCAPSFIKETENVVHLVNESQGETSYLWDFDDGTYSSSIYSPYHQFSVDSINGYEVKLTVVNEFNCVDTAIRFINIKPDPLIYVPNSFTPDGSNLNDVFIPKMSNGIDEKNYSFTIFNRWGEIIFETNITTEGWNGKTKNNELVQDGVYTWAIKYAVFDSSKVIEMNGHVNLMR